MTSALFEVNKKYWTDRAPSYSQVNQEELAGCQRSNWLREISRQIQMVYPNRQYSVYRRKIQKINQKLQEDAK